MKSKQIKFGLNKTGISHLLHSLRLLKEDIEKDLSHFINLRYNSIGEEREGLREEIAILEVKLFEIGYISEILQEGLDKLLEK